MNQDSAPQTPSVQTPPVQTSPVQTPQVQPSQVLQHHSWWQSNRTALMLLLPLLALALAASSYRMTTLYRPNEYTRPHLASGAGLAYHEAFTNNRQPYQRDVNLTLLSLRPVATEQGERPAQGAALWLIELRLAAQPNVPLSGCEVSIQDTEGRLYNSSSGKFNIYSNLLTNDPKKQVQLGDCVPQDTPGPNFDFTGQLLPDDSRARPAEWVAQFTVALPQGRQPRYVRVAWQPPNYALLPVK